MTSSNGSLQTVEGLGYRRDIDGLRALAVLPVLLYHADLRVFSGGFVGVDIFFVISGFLITRIVQKDLHLGRFSIAGFYERRLRRILPALLVMLFASTLAAFIILLPQDLRTFAITAGAAILSFSNIVFMRQEGYFQPQADLQPLLHTWSLGVEEQFYLIFPFMLATIFHARRKAVPAFILTVLVLSFAACVALTLTRPVAAFYLAPTRAWELMIGASLALGLVRPASKRTTRELLSALGLLGIICSVLLFDASMAFPGYIAALPCIGTALIISSAPGTRVGRLLGHKWLVGVGLVSYSLYLWHWPILAFARYYLVREMTGLETAIALALSALAAVLSWRYVERPFRNHATMPTQRTLRLAAALSVVIVGCSGLFVVAEGFPQRMGATASRLADGQTDMTAYRDTCLFRPDRNAQAVASCRLGTMTAAPAVLLWGDSQGDAISPAIDVLARESGLGVVNATHVSCPPVLDVEVIENGLSRECKSWNDAVRRFLTGSDIKVVVLSARWAAYAHGRGYGPDAEKTAELVGVSDKPLITGLESSLRLLNGKRVYLISSTPEIEYDVPNSLARLAWSGMDMDLRPTLVSHATRQQIVQSDLVRLAEKYGVDVIDPARFFCKVRCEIEAAGYPYYYDNHHLSRRGALAMAPYLRTKLTL